MRQKPIGGYFEWEFPPQRNYTIHSNAVLLNSGRHALEYILRGLGDVSKLYIPYFTCDVIIQPLKYLNIPYTFYQINENLEIALDIQLSGGEYLLYTNYYGIKDTYVEHIAEKYRDKIIIDNAQALFCPEYAVHQFYSPRKFMGMPDGGMVVSDLVDYSLSLSQSLSFDKCSHLLKRIELIPIEGYNDFRNVSKLISESSLSKMSKISEHILRSVDLNQIHESRRRNFMLLHKYLKKSNKLVIPDFDSFECPLVYPYWTSDKDLKSHLIKEQVFVATYWPNVLDWTTPDMIEYELANNCLAIPCDQRYGDEDMKRIIELILRK